MNRQLSTTESTLLRNKLGRVVVKLQQQAKAQGTNTDYDTLESVVAESTKILSEFYKYLAEPSYQPVTQVVDTVPDAISFNKNFEIIEDDLFTIFREFENLETVVLGKFNYMVSRMNRLHRRMKQVSSQLGDYILFSNEPTKDAIFFTDSFNNLTRVEAGSPLLNEEECFINQVEGIASLPVDRNAQVAINVTEVPVINSSSNGTRGNNEELGVDELHGDITAILDSDADTWFEYEQLFNAGKLEDGIPDDYSLTLDFTINLGDPIVINHIRINPNNFGTRTQINIVNIDTSINGKDFVSIKADIPGDGFIESDNDGEFDLAPSTSKFAGQGLYTFTPRKAKYVRLTLRQITPYRVITKNGVDKWRFAIGVRDVHIEALPYKTKGEVISTEYASVDEIRKVVVEASQNPSSETVSDLASIQHYISPDNGVTWHEVRPFISSGIANADQTVPELLDFNGVVDGSVATSSPVNSIRYKALLTRNAEAFNEDAAELAQEIGVKTELHKPPTTSPMNFIIDSSPVEGSLKLIDPQFGSRGKDIVKYQIATGTGGKLKIDLPWKPFKRDIIKTDNYDGTYQLDDLDPQKVYVDGIEWTRGALTGSSNVYAINYESGTLEFGDGTDGNAVAAGQFVSMNLEEERLAPGRGEDHITKLDYSTSNDKEQMEIYQIDGIQQKTVTLEKGRKRWQLDPNILNHDDAILIYSDFGIASSHANWIGSTHRKDFINGDSELNSSQWDWSCDWENGALYSANTPPANLDITVTYRYYPQTRLEEDEWDFIDIDNGVANAISIKDRAFKTHKADQLTAPSGVRYFNLGHLSVVEGTVVFIKGGSTPTELTTEIPFVDGRSELLGVVPAAEEVEPLTYPGGDGIVSFSLKCYITEDTSFDVKFSNSDIFSSEQTYNDGETELSSVGDYSVNRANGGTVYVKISEDVAEPGFVNYYYVNPQIDPNSFYSINYETGEVFTHTPTSGTIYANYEYTNYVARYDIAREVPQEDWEFDISSKKITIKDREILKSNRTPQQEGGLGTTHTKFYQAVYKYVKGAREDVDELEPFFSPILKNYSLKVITKSRLV